jgi:hypothetical protein
MAIIAFSFTSCKPDGKDPEGGGQTNEIAAPDQIVSVEQARAMYNNYTERRVPLIQHYEDSINRSRGNNKMQRDNQAQGDSITFDVARFTYYDLETIKQYISYIEQEAQRANVEISSLRLYFSNYPDQEKFESGNPVVHPRQNSLFMIPTIKKGDREYGFSVISDDEGKWSPVLLGDQLQPVDNTGLGTREENAKGYATFVPLPAEPNFVKPSVSFAGGKSLIMNEGSMVPPPYH